MGENLVRDADRWALLDELLSRADPDDSSFARRAGRFGLEPGRSEVVVCVKVLHAEGEVDGPSPTHWAANAVALASGRGASRAFVVARLDDVVAVLDAAGPHNPRTVLTEVASAAERRKMTIQAAIGHTFTDLAGVLDSYNSAMRALRHTGRARPIVWSPSDITLFEELVLSYAGDGQRLIPTKTRRVLSDPTVRSTLEALFKANLNVAVAAEALFLHPNSLRYRLAAITRSTGRDPRKPRDLFELCAAVRVLDAGSADLTLIDDFVVSYVGAAHALIPEQIRRVLAEPTTSSTLLAYLAADGNVADAARRLNVHPNTVRYRLARVAELSGRDPRIASDLFELTTAARIVEARVDSL